MSRSRLEAFSDGVIAVLITILVLELKVPHGVDAAALKPMLPVFLSYVARPGPPHRVEIGFLAAPGE